MTASTKTAFARGDKKKLAIKIIEDNIDLDFFEVANMISVALDLNKYAGRAYYKYMIKHGLISKYQPTDTPWKSAKAAAKEAKAPKPKAAKAAPVKKEKVKKEVEVEATAPSTEPEKPATTMIRDFIKKQRAQKNAA